MQDGSRLTPSALAPPYPDRQHGSLPIPLLSPREGGVSATESRGECMRCLDRHMLIGKPPPPPSVRHARPSLASTTSGLAVPAPASGDCGACSALCAWIRPGNDPTGKAIPRIAARIRPLIVRLAMDDHGRTPVMEERVLTRPECGVRDIGNQGTCAIGGNQQIRQIARVEPFGVL
jgi:hypothetical protein